MTKGNSMRYHKLCSAALVSAALCFSTTNAAAASCQVGGAGCLLPFQAAPAYVPPVAGTAAPVTPVDVAPVVADSGVGILPILLALAAAGLLAFVLLDDDDAVSA